MIRPALIALLLCTLTLGEKTQPKSEGVALSESETLARVQGQLLGAMALIESLESPQEYPGGEPLTAEKRRNKFEFIRFGRK